MRRAWDPFGLGERIVFLGATGGHFASTVSIERLRRLNPFLAMSISSLSFLQPIERIVAQLEARRPRVIATYPSAAILLAGEFRAGRLRSAPEEIWTGGETLTPGMRSFVQEAFGCAVVNSLYSGCLSSPATLILLNMGNFTPKFVVQKAWISSFVPGSWLLKLFAGNPATTSPCPRNRSYKFSRPSYCGVSPHFEATFTSSRTLPLNSASEASSPVIFCTRTS